MEGFKADFIFISYCQQIIKLVILLDFISPCLVVTSLLVYSAIGLLLPNVATWGRAVSFCKILVQNYAPEAAASWSNIQSPICSRSISWMHTAPRAYLAFAICSWSIVYSNILLEHIRHRILFQIIYAPGTCSLSLLLSMLLEHNLGPKSHRSERYYNNTAWISFISPQARLQI